MNDKSKEPEAEPKEVIGDLESGHDRAHDIKHSPCDDQYSVYLRDPEFACERSSDRRRAF